LVDKIKEEKYQHYMKVREYKELEVRWYDVGFLTLYDNLNKSKLGGRDRRE
jgi:hypothetical protein